MEKKLYGAESQDQISHSKLKAIAAIIGILSACVLLVSLVSHVTLDVMARTVFDFAIHHYFIMIFVSFLILTASIKVYTSLDDKFDRAYREKHCFELSKNRTNKLKFFNLFETGRGKTDAEASRFLEIEEVRKLKFPEEDVLNDVEAKFQRQRDLQKATVLGNSYKQKVIVFFKDDESKKHLITTIWQSTSDHISFKNGNVLPVKSILKIEF